MPPRILRKVRRATPPARVPGLVYPRRKELLLPGPVREVERAEFKLLVEAFRNQPGINVRPPSHQAPPIRALPIEAIATRTFNVTAAQGRVVMLEIRIPTRHAGVLTAFSISLQTATDTNAWVTAAGTFAQLLVNDKIIFPNDAIVTVANIDPTLAGVSDRRQDLLLYRSQLSGGTAIDGGISSFNAVNAQALVPIFVPLFSGDVVRLIVNEAALVGTPTALRLACYVKGSYYPQRATTGDRGILGTLVD